jgi:ribosomal peptide maturation radical SAM protein 1
MPAGETMAPLIQIGEQNEAAAEPLERPFALVSMPSLSGRFPSFQLGLLKPTLEREGIDCQTFSLFLYFGTHIGWRLNEALSEVSSALVGEWIWAKAAFGDFADEEEYLARFRPAVEAVCRQADCTVEDLLRVRNEKVFSFLDFCMESVDWSRFFAVGLSVVFQQTLATLAFARRLRSEHPDLPILLGGGFFEDDIAEEVLKGCSYVDYIHCGDADETLPPILRRLHRGESAVGMAGLRARDDDGVIVGARAPNLQDLSKTPVPDFDEYFYAREEGGYGAFEGRDEVMLPIETARGCWWGMKNHCTFCGLNRAGMDFRSKPADDVLEMLKALHRRYDQLHFDAIDNIIEPRYVEQLFGKLADARSDVRIHYEVRPSLKRAQLRIMKAGGLFSVQPGIESLSTHVLQLMNKRTTAMRNLEFMKWCTYFGIHNLYNILLRFPGETQEDYDEQTELIELIGHLQPPKYIVRVRADRGSPMFTAPDDNGVLKLRPTPCYPYLYPTERFDLSRISYYFEHDMPSALDDSAYAGIFDAVARWQHRWQERPRPTLRYFKSWDTLRIVDARYEGTTELVLEDREARLYEALLDARRLDHLEAELDEPPEVIEGVLGELVDRGLVVHRDGLWLALALPAHAGH